MCTFNIWCPKCLICHKELGDYSRFPPCDYNEALETFHLANGDVKLFNAACHKVDLKPVFHPFWEKLHLVDISLSLQIFCIRCFRALWSIWFHGWQAQVHSELQESTRTVGPCHQITISWLLSRGSQFFLGSQALDTSKCARLSMAWSWTFCYTLVETQPRLSGWCVLFLISSTSHNFPHILPTLYSTLRNPSLAFMITKMYLSI